MYKTSLHYVKLVKKFFLLQNNFFAFTDGYI